MNKRPKLTWKNLNWPVVWIIIIYLVVTVVVLMACGCANLDYGDLHYSRAGNWKAELVIFTEHVEDPNGHSDVTIIIIGPDINHDDMAGKLAEGIVKGLKN